MSHRSNIGALRDSDGNIVFDDCDKAEMFNKYFASVGVVDDGISPLCSNNLENNLKLENVLFTEENVM